MNAAHTETGSTDPTPVQGAPRRFVDDAWVAMNRRYATGAAGLLALLLLLWVTGNGPGAWRAAGQRTAEAPAAASGNAGNPTAAPAGASAPAGSGPAVSGAVSAAPGPGTSATGTPGAASGAASASVTGPAAGATAPAPSAPAASSAPSAVPSSPAPGAGGAPAASPRPVPGAPVARLYFDANQSSPSGEVGPRLAPVLARLKADPEAKALVSGYHDRRGAPERNAALAQRRAQAVRRVLIREGVAAHRIVLAKPQQTQGSGSDREARRVEVTVAR
jgi:outer membrane protein OmpA-like peptidoglycan-associated protein